MPGLNKSVVEMCQRSVNEYSLIQQLHNMLMKNYNQHVKIHILQACQGAINATATGSNSPLTIKYLILISFIDRQT